MTRYWVILTKSRRSGRILKSNSAGRDNVIMNNLGDRIRGCFLDEPGARYFVERLKETLKLEVTPGQACQFLGIQREILNRECNAGRLAYSGTKHRKRFLMEELKRWAVNQKSKAPWDSS